MYAGIEQSFWLTLIFIGCWVAMGIFLAKDFVEFERACKKNGIDDVDAFLHYNKYDNDIRKLAKRAWTSIFLWGLMTVVMLL